ncbi:hypothetical protein GCM10010411_75490 [Actinomadura fulvescens]|uniref:Uncharacterized protein n=1 Tax=Actinomadura fulvescens TaxID=46160 RepID=A0ABN3QIK5_9ACTN
MFVFAVAMVAWPYIARSADPPGQETGVLLAGAGVALLARRGVVPVRRAAVQGGSRRTGNKVWEQIKQRHPID